MKIAKKYISKDKKTTKFLQVTDDSSVIETGYYELDEHIICISTQIGCNLGCIFCATTTPNKQSEKKFIRNLTSKEIVEQVTNVLSSVDVKKNNKKRILFSFMGMGEPFLNYNNLVNSIKTLSGLYPNSRTTVSTTGINPEKMKQLANEDINTLLKMHLSLHAPNQKIREKIMPGTNQIKKALDALQYFSNKREVLSRVNYMLIDGVNDSKDNAKQLTDLLKDYNFAVKLSNLNDFNNLHSSKNSKFKMFEDILKANNIKTTQFISIGTDIEAGCGQLRKRYLDK